VHRHSHLERGEVAHCHVCGTVLWRSSELSIDGWLALTLSAFIVFIVANAFPVLSVGVENFRSDVTLWQATTSLVKGAWAPLGAPVTLVAIVIPCVQLLALLWILGFAQLRHRAPSFRFMMRLLTWLRPWSMTEVALLGVIVAAIKLSGMASVAIGPGAWAMFALVILMALTTKRDVRWLWNATAPFGAEVIHGH